MCQRGGVSNEPPWAPGSEKRWGQGSFGPFTGGVDLRGSLQPAELNQMSNMATLTITTYENFLKKTDRTFDPF